MPLVSVLIPCYNAGNYLHAAIQSILAQTHKNIEIIAIDDCSSDRTLEILKQYESSDKRVKLFVNEENLGLIKTLNKGINLASGEFIARMDQDDISLPNRIAVELEEMISDTSLDLVSCGAYIINGSGKKIFEKPIRTTHTKSNLFESFFGPPFIHPTVFFRTQSLKKYYYHFSQTTKHIEDFDLWSRMLMGGSKTKVNPQPLFLYRDFSENTTHKHDASQSENMVIISKQNFKIFLGIEMESKIHRIIVNRQESSISKFDLSIALEKLNEIKEVFFEKEKPSVFEQNEIIIFLQIHKADILIQYILKNKIKSYYTFLKHFSGIISPKILKYVFLKFYRKIKTG